MQNLVEINNEINKVTLTHDLTSLPEQLLYSKSRGEGIQLKAQAQSFRPNTNLCHWPPPLNISIPYIQCLES